MLRWAALAIGLFCASPTIAQDIPPEIDKTLWCASAFYWLAGSADDSGDAAEAELYDGWSTGLLDEAAKSLHTAGVASDRIEAIIAEYDQQVLEELGTETARHDVGTCPGMVAPVDAAPPATTGN